MPKSSLGKTVAIVQARLGSSRLPMKSLLCLHGYPIIDWVTQRLSTSRLLDKIIVATPDTRMDMVLHEHLRRRNIETMAGSENDVLSRFCDAARLTGADTVVRVCADNPLLWGEAVDRLLLFYAVTHCDYAYNHIPRNNLWPDGLGAEVLSADLLLDLERKAETPAQREHCLNYIWDNADRYCIATFDPEEASLRRPDIRLDVDTPQDFVRLALAPLRIDMRADEVVQIMDRPAGEWTPPPNGASPRVAELS